MEKNIKERNFLEFLEEQLMRKEEHIHVEYKNGFVWKEHTDMTYKIIKAILCMSNLKDGGRIIIGFDESKDEIGLTDEQYSSYDVTKVNDLLHSYCDPIVNCRISKPELSGQYYPLLKGKKIIVIDVPEFEHMPIICIKGHHGDGKDPILKAGMLYCRTGKASCENKMDPKSIREVIDRATNKNGAKLLNQISELFKASGYIPQPASSGGFEGAYTKQLKESLLKIDGALTNG